MNKITIKILGKLGLEFCYSCKKRIPLQPLPDITYWTKGYKHRICKRCWRETHFYLDSQHKIFNKLSYDQTKDLGSS